MRFKKTNGVLKLYAVAGTKTVLLSFDIDKEKFKGKNFLGFSVKRSGGGVDSIQINGSKHFDSLVHDDTITDPKIKYCSLVQSFFWKDYEANPGKKYVYTVQAMFGEPKHYECLFENAIKVTTEKLLDGKHSVFFNFGVTGSQGFAKATGFGNQPLRDLKGNNLQEALDYLGRELWPEGLVAFVRQAKNSRYKLRCAFYEFQYMPFLMELKAAKNRGADVQVIYSAKSDQIKDKVKHGEKMLGNTSSIQKAGLSSICFPRTKPSQPHNKFMVLIEDEKPIAVWLGSTKITIPGIFGHCNTGHWVHDAKIAKQYLTYWNGVKDDPAMSVQSKTDMEIQDDMDLRGLDDGVYTFFSPRDLPKQKGVETFHLQAYANLINSAKELVCMIFPFNFDPVFAKVYRGNKPYLRYLLFEKPATAKSVKSNDNDLKVTAGAILDSNVEDWVKEVTAKYTTDAGILFVHNKFFLIDPLSDDPIVLTGSANFSTNSIQNNDENSILIKGDKRVADIYLSEFNRLFEHFWPRYLREIKKGKGKGFEEPLDETNTWHKDYFIASRMKCKRRLMFTQMKGAKQG